MQLWVPEFLTFAQWSMRMKAVEKRGIAANRTTVVSAAVRMATLLSALPAKDRLVARMELVDQVERGQRQEPTNRALCPVGSIVCHEIERIAELLVGAFRSALAREYSPLWGDFSLVLNKYLDVIEGDAERAMTERRRAETTLESS
jgi:hypothetical protein